MTKNKALKWNEHTCYPDDDRDILLSDGTEVEVGHYDASDRRYKSDALKTVKFWMEIPEPPKLSESYKDSYLFYKACRNLVVDFKTSELDSVAMHFIEHAEVILRVYDSAYTKFFEEWKKDKNGYASGYLDSVGLLPERNWIK